MLNISGSALPSDKGQRGETLGDVTLSGDQTPFSCDLDYVLGDAMFSYSLEATFKTLFMEAWDVQQVSLWCSQDSLRTAWLLMAYSSIPLRTRLRKKQKNVLDNRSHCKGLVWVLLKSTYVTDMILPSGFPNNGSVYMQIWQKHDTVHWLKEHGRGIKMFLGWTTWGR